MSDIEILQIELTTRCTARCPFCARVQLKYVDKTDLSLDTIKKIPFENLKRVTLSGSLGEPTCHPKFLDMIKYMREKNKELKIVIATNGFTHNEDWWYELGKSFADPGYAVFGVDGLEDTHSIHRRGTRFKPIIRNIRAFNSSGGESLMQTIIFRHNEHQLQDLKKLSVEIGCTKMFYRVSKEYNDVLQRPLMDIRTRSEINLEGGKITCFTVERKEIYLNVDGFLSPCFLLSSRRHHHKEEGPQFLKKFNESLNQVNLNNCSFKEIIKNDYFQYVLDNIGTLVTCNKACKCKLSELIHYL